MSNYIAYEYEPYIDDILERLQKHNIINVDNKISYRKNIVGIIKKRTVKNSILPYCNKDIRIWNVVTDCLCTISNDLFSQTQDKEKFRSEIMDYVTTILTKPNLSRDIVLMAVTEILKEEFSLLEEIVEDYDNEFSEDDEIEELDENNENIPIIEFSHSALNDEFRISDDSEHDTDCNQNKECGSFSTEPPYRLTFKSLSDPIKDEYGEHDSWYTRRRIRAMNSIMQKPINDDDRNLASIAHILLSFSLSKEKCTELLRCFGKYSDSIPENYKSLCKAVLKKSCIPIFLRRIVTCRNCRNSFDDTRQYCPFCWRERKQLFRLYKDCPVEKCKCSASNLSPKHDDMCPHYRAPDYEGYHYISPIGIICDLIHNNYWNEFMGLTEESLVKISKYCLTTNGYSTFTSLNMMDICNEYGMKDAAEMIQQIHTHSLYDHSTPEVMHKMALAYQKSKRSLMCNNMYLDFLKEISKRYNRESFLEAFLKEWLDDVSMDIIPSLQSDNWTSDQDLFQPFLHKLLPLFPLAFYQNKKAYGILNEQCMLYKTITKSKDDLYNKRRMNNDGNPTKVRKYSRILQTAKHNNLLKVLKDTFTNLDSIHCENFFYCSMRKLCELIVQRYSSADHKFPVIWVSRAKSIFRYMAMRACLRLAIKNYCEERLDELHTLLDDYCLMLSGTANCYEDNYSPLNVISGSSKNILRENINIMIGKLKSLKGLETQCRLLRKLSLLLEEADTISECQQVTLSEKELIEPSFIMAAPQDHQDSLLRSKFVEKLMKELNMSDSNMVSLSHELATMTISCDDVEIFRYSKTLNSAFVLSGFFTGIPHYLHFTNKANWFMAILPATKSRSLENFSSMETSDDDRLSRKRLYQEEDAKDRETASTEQVYEVFQDDYNNSPYCMLQETGDLKCLARKQVQLSPSNWKGRAITNLILKDIKLLGDRGIPIFFDSVLHFIRPAVLGFRFDNVAGNLLANSSGKQSSAAPCRDCDFCVQYWNKLSNTLTYAYDGDWFKNRKKRAVSMSVLSSLERDDPLRMISLISLFKEGDEDFVFSILDPEERYRIYYKELRHEISDMLSYCKLEHKIYWSAPNTEYFPPVLDKDSDRHTNHEKSIGYIDYRNVVTGQNALKGKDSMHLLDNLGMEFREYFHKQNTIIYDELTGELVQDFIIPKSISMSSPGFARHTLFCAQYIAKKNKSILPYRIHTIIDSFLSSNAISPGKSNQINLTSQEKLHFTLIYSQFLFLSSFSDGFCITYTRLFNVLGRILAFRGSIEAFDLLYKEMVVLLHAIENEKVFDSSTINDHLFVHQDLSYLFMGPPKAIDCYEPEWTYSALKHPYPTPNPLVTLHYNQTISLISNILEKPKPSASPMLENDVGDQLKEEFYMISDIQFSIRVLSAYNSSKRYQECSTAAILTLWDIEATSTVRTFLEGGYFTSSIKPNLVLSGDCLLPTNESDMKDFANRIGLANTSRFMSIPSIANVKLFSKCSYNKTVYNAVYYPSTKIHKNNLSYLNKRKSYAFVMDIHGNPHLVCLLGFFSVEINTESYGMAYCYEIPIKFLYDNPSPYIAIVCQEQYTYVRNFVSIDRLHPAIFVDSVLFDYIFVINNKIVPYQYV